jgi:hypothetical protein
MEEDKNIFSKSKPLFENVYPAYPVPESEVKKMKKIPASLMELEKHKDALIKHSLD